MATLLTLIILTLFLLHLLRRPKRSSTRATPYRNKEEVVGSYGEQEALDTLRTLDGRNRIFSNLYLPTGEGTTTEVDLLWICRQGIFVLEVKHYSGWIFASERNRYWTQVLKGGHKSRFYNPIWQNKAHIAALRALLHPTYAGKYFNVIVFSDHCTLKDVSYHSAHTMIVQQEGLSGYLKTMVASLPAIISEERIDEISSRLAQYEDTAPHVYHEHIQSIEHTYRRH